VRPDRSIGPMCGTPFLPKGIGSCGYSGRSVIKVSIVVPVYNGGPYLDLCAPSLLRQSIGADAYEIIYVDDGSTDDSAQRLDRLAAEHRHVRVIHQENSGWPGKPRNVGVRVARGEYVQFVDQDDELTPQALERLHDLAVRNNSDIVMGKVAGTMQGPSNVFKRTVEQCTVEDAPLFESLTPHKMFRRDFLLGHGIEFPEGPVRLEDQLFMARAYVRAKTVSILAGPPCYLWNRREDGGNTSSRATTPEDYYGHLRNVVDAGKEVIPPGPLQDPLLRRSYRVELLRPVIEPRLLQRTGRHPRGLVRPSADRCRRREGGHAARAAPRPPAPPLLPRRTAPPGHRAPSPEAHRPRSGAVLHRGAPPGARELPAGRPGRPARDQPAPGAPAGGGPPGLPDRPGPQIGVCVAEFSKAHFRILVT